MSLITPWGYTLSDSDALPRMLTAEDFEAITAGKYGSDVRVDPLLDAACMSVRNYCGWHVFPTQTCAFSERLLAGNGRIKRVGSDILIQLPATYVTGVSSVLIDGEESTEYDLATNGLLRIFDVYCHTVTRKTVITVEYTAGIPDALMNSIKELVASRVSRGIANPNGVASESAGGVSVSYSASWSNGGGAGTLQSTDIETLEPYKVRGVF